MEKSCDEQNSSVHMTSNVRLHNNLGDLQLWSHSRTLLEALSENPVHASFLASESQQSIVFFGLY